MVSCYGKPSWLIQWDSIQLQQAGTYGKRQAVMQQHLGKKTFFFLFMRGYSTLEWQKLHPYGGPSWSWEKGKRLRQWISRPLSNITNSPREIIPNCNNFKLNGFDTFKLLSKQKSDEIFISIIEKDIF